MTPNEKLELQFLYTIVKQFVPKELPEGNAPMFYITGSYDNDLKVIEQIEAIGKKYNFE